MVKEATCTWDLKPSQNHVVAFVASERWKEQVLGPRKMTPILCWLWFFTLT